MSVVFAGRGLFSVINELCWIDTFIHVYEVPVANVTRLIAVTLPVVGSTVAVAVAPVPSPVITTFGRLPTDAEYPLSDEFTVTVQLPLLRLFEAFAVAWPIETTFVPAGTLGPSTDIPTRIFTASGRLFVNKIVLPAAGV